MSQLQGNQFEKIKGVMDQVGLKYHPADMAIRREDLVNSLLNLKEYVKQKPNLWFSIIDDSIITREWALKALEGLRF